MLVFLQKPMQQVTHRVRFPRRYLQGLVQDGIIHLGYVTLVERGLGVTQIIIVTNHIEISLLCI